MKLALKILFAFSLATVNTCLGQKYVGEFSKTEFDLSGNRLNFFRDMFETKAQMLDFMEIKKGDVIAEVGAGYGWNLGVLSMIYDSVTFYAQDISAKVLSEKHWKKTVSYYEKHRKTGQTNKFERVIGTLSATNLPDGIFDKILVIDAYHDFDKKDDIIEDISKKLKANGKIYILDGFSFPGDTQICPDNGKHVLTTLAVEINRFEKHGFYLTKMRGPDYRSHYGQGVVFEKDKNKTQEFYTKKSKIDLLVTGSVAFWKKEIAGDSLAMKEIVNALLPKIKEITHVYKEYEVWVKDIGLRHLRRLNYSAAINIFRANTKFFPESYQSWYWLGVAYQESKQNRLAAQCLKRSLELDPDNDLASKKIKQAEKN